jgi:predicted MPP superfamily phosphohydrolase
VAIDDALAQGNIGTARDRLGKLVDLLERSGINPDEIGRVEKINVWQGFLKDNEGNPQLVDMAGIVLSPEWAGDPEYPVVQQAAPTTIKPIKSTPNTTNLETVVILPDPQIGYLRLSDGEMIACHDEDAMDVALQITRHAKPDTIVNLGDFLDLPEWSSKFLVLPEFVMTTQPTLDRAHRFLAEQRAVAPDANMVLIAGNHDDRLGKAIAKNAMAALRLRRAEAPKEWAVLSVPFLLRLDELKVQYVGGYPAGRYKIADACPEAGLTPFYAIHGEKLDIPKVAKTERQSIVQGHIHRQALHYETYEVDGRPETVLAVSPGCLCRVDGAVPSTKNGHDETGRPLVRWESWQQGMMVVTIDKTSGKWDTELIRIHQGEATWRGRTFRSTRLD